MQTISFVKFFDFSLTFCNFMLELNSKKLRLENPSENTYQAVYPKFLSVK